MDPRTGFVYDIIEPGDPPRDGAKIRADVALEEGIIDVLGRSMEGLGIGRDHEDRLAEMVENKEELVAVGAEAAQRARLGDRELRRRRQRRR